MRKLWLVPLLLLIGYLIGCGNAASEGTTPAAAPIPTAPAIPPTFTPAPPDSDFGAIPIVTVTQAPLPAMETSTPIPFGANVVELRMSIPSLGFDRRLQGSVSSQIILVDESNGFSVQRDNQASVLLDLQNVLPELVLAAVPDGCDGCVHLTYNLPFSGVQGDGWLRDAVLLASLENYFTTVLGPHFPSEAIIGLRRSASPYAPAHSVAVMADGRLYRWLVSESEAAPVSSASSDLLAAFEALNPPALQQQYTAPCPGSSLESLLVAGRENERLIALVCPEFSLSADLQPLYVALDAALNEVLLASESTIARPPALFPLSALVDYQRVDGAQLTIFADDTAVASSSGSSQPITTTLGSSQVISLTTNLLSSGSLRTGLNTFLVDEGSGATATPTAPRSVVVMRGPAGVYDAQWFNTSEVAELAELNDLLNQLLSGGTAVPAGTVEATPEEPIDEAATATPTALATPAASPSPTPADE